MDKGNIYFDNRLFGMNLFSGYEDWEIITDIEGKNRGIRGRDISAAIIRSSYIRLRVGGKRAWAFAAGIKKSLRTFGGRPAFPAN